MSGLVYIKTFGCQMNEYDSSKMQDVLEAAKGMTRTEDPAQVLQSHGGASVAVGLAVDDKSFATAYAGLRRGGLATVFALHRAGRTRVVAATRPLAAVNDTIDEVLDGKAKARIVLQP